MCDDRIVMELKFMVNRQHKLSRALDGDDLALKTKLAMFDDVFFSRGRNQLSERFYRA